MEKPTIMQQVTGLEKAGFRFHSTSTLKINGAKHADVYKGDTLTEPMRESLKNQFGEWVNFGKSESQYAPEIRRPVVYFLRKI